jgi:hypothetical protein
MSFILEYLYTNRGVWARTTVLLSRKPMMGRLGDLATPKQATTYTQWKRWRMGWVLSGLPSF